ncbi:hypothetical protein LUZ60_013354 [Juncus effusus]|nr:hypothetical protein LUZ60_013354 [Juncus effusus]
MTVKESEVVARKAKVMKTLSEKKLEYIKPPKAETSNVIKRNPRFSPFFDNCIGAIDGTHIHASPPTNESAAFRGRKGYPTQNVLAAVDFKLRFLYILAGWEGSAHDALVLKDAIEREDGIPLSEGKYYLADAGYLTRPGFISPFRGVRYHLKEFSNNLPLTDKDLFNHRHSSLRTTIERAFGALKNRFKILTSRPFFPYPKQVEIVMACCIIHNFIITHTNGPDSFVPTIEEIENADENDIGEAPTSTYRRQRTTREQQQDAREWVAIRDNIMRQMWEHNSRG